MRYMVQIINCTDFFWRDNYLACFKHNKRKKTIFNIPLRECSDRINTNRSLFIAISWRRVRLSHVEMILHIHWGLDFSFRVNWFRVPWKYYIYIYAYAHMFTQVRYADIRHPRFPRTLLRWVFFFLFPGAFPQIPLN